MAQSIFPDMAIEIQVSHICEQEGSGVPKRLYQRRSNRSNSTGMVGLISYTHLTAGIWKFSCRANQEPALEGMDASSYAWPGTIQLLVHPHSILADDDWDGGSSSAADLTGADLPAIEVVSPIQVQPEIAVQPEEAPRPVEPDPFQPAADLSPLSAEFTKSAESKTELPLVADLGNLEHSSSNPESIPPESIPTESIATEATPIEMGPKEMGLLSGEGVEDATEIAAIELTISEAIQPATIPPSEEIESDELESDVIASFLAGQDEEVTAEPNVELSSVNFNDGIEAIETATGAEPERVALPLLSLDECAFTLAKGDVLNLTGTVLTDCDLVIQLRDPGNKNLVWQEYLPLAGQTIRLPRAFQCRILPPANYGLLLGEAKLVGADFAGEADGNEALQMQESDLCHQQTFLITLMEQALVDPTECPEVPFEYETADTSPRAHAIQLPVFAADLPPLSLKVVQGPTLPPRLNLRSTAKPVAKPLELPSFTPQQQPLADKASVAVTETIAMDPAMAKPAELPDDFASLQLQKRFWGILNSLAQSEASSASATPAATQPPSALIQEAPVLVAVGVASSANGLEAEASPPADCDLDLPHFLN
jgi:hypothetical protein